MKASKERRGRIMPKPEQDMTEGEEKQRRKGNRLAAHNLRQRKLQEVGALQQDKNALELRIHQLEARNNNARGLNRS